MENTANNFNQNPIDIIEDVIHSKKWAFSRAANHELVAEITTESCQYRLYFSWSEQIKAIVTDIQAMINQHPKTNQEGKVRFQEFGSSSLDILVMYFVDSPKWNDLIDVKEDVNYKIMEIVKRHNSDFAFPSTTVYLQK
jgi:small-conductance mechanosensitive channel